MIDGMYVFSKSAAEEEKRWLKCMERHKGGAENILGRLKSVANKGIIVDCDGVNAFVPFSHAANINVNQNFDTIAPIWFKIKGIDEARRTIILSRKAYLGEENQRLGKIS